VGRIVTAYIADREAEGIHSSQRQRDAWKAMRGFWEHVDPGLIDKEMAQSYAARRPAAPATIRYELSMLAVACRWAKARKHIQEAPEVWRPAPPDRKVRHLSRSRFEKWFPAVKAPHARLYVELGIATMARPSAILELQWPQVDWEREQVDFNPPGRRQTKKRRPIVPLNADAMEALRTAYAARQSQYVIERRLGGRGWREHGGAGAVHGSRRLSDHREALRPLLAGPFAPGRGRGSAEEKLSAGGSSVPSAPVYARLFSMPLRGRRWSGREDSNLRPLPPERIAPNRIGRFSVVRARAALRSRGPCSCTVHAIRFALNFEPLSICPPLPGEVVDRVAGASV
jgi:hypothetical protein